MRDFVQGIDRPCAQCNNPCMAQEKTQWTEDFVLALMARFGSDERAAAALGVNRTTFYRWRRKFGLEYGRVPLKAA